MILSVWLSTCFVILTPVSHILPDKLANIITIIIITQLPLNVVDVQQKKKKKISWILCSFPLSFEIYLHIFIITWPRQRISAQKQQWNPFEQGSSGCSYILHTHTLGIRMLGGQKGQTTPQKSGLSFFLLQCGILLFVVCQRKTGFMGGLM